MNRNNLHQRHAMSKLFFIVIALLAGTAFSYGQMNVSVAPIKMNVLYIGVDNPVSIAVSGATDDKVTVSIVGGGGTISKTGDGLYNVRVTSPTDDCVMNVYVDGKLAGSSNFRVRNMPMPSATVDGLASGTYLTADALRSKSGVGVYIQNFPFEAKYEVTGFSVKLMDDKGNLKTADCPGNLLTDKAKQYIGQYAKSGDIVTIENIKVKAPGGTELKLPALMYMIK